MSVNGRGTSRITTNETILELHRPGARPTIVLPCLSVNLDNGGVRITLIVNGGTIVTRFFPSHSFTEARSYRGTERINPTLITGGC